MRFSRMVVLGLGTALFVSGCGQSNETKVEDAIKSVNVIDESNLNDVMLTVADPNEAVAYFRRATSENPNRIDLHRGLAMSYVRAAKPREAAKAWEGVIEMPGSSNADRVEYADALIRANEWAKAEAVLDQVPPTHETYKRYRLEAMIADGNKEWQKADSFYEIAVGLTTKPSGTLNNWGYSNLTRGNYAKAEQLFGEALSYDPAMFTAKNNLVLARAAQRKYDLPVIQMSQVERAQLLYTAALSAIKQGDVSTGRTLLRQAIDTNPQYFEAAVRSLEALDGSGA